MQYRETLPSPKLRPFIKCFWSLEQTPLEAAGSREPVLPDGCFEIVFNLADRFRKFNSEEDIELQPRTLVAGQMTRSIVIGPSGDVNLFGVRFQPTGAYPFFGFPMAEMTNRIASLDELLANGSANLAEQIAACSRFESRIAVFEKALLKKLECVPVFDNKLKCVISSVSSEPECMTVSKIAAKFGWSERSLERAFKKRVGVSPKMFSRICRFSGIVHLLESNGPAKLLQYAHDFGYYDQAHMINEFRGFAGESPTAFYNRSHRLSELFTVGK